MGLVEMVRWWNWEEILEIDSTGASEIRLWWEEKKSDEGMGGEGDGDERESGGGGGGAAAMKGCGWRL